MTETIEGINPVMEALRAGRPVNRILVARGIRSREGIARIRHLASQRGVPVVYVERSGLERITATGRHQGVVALVAPREYADLDELLEEALAGPQPLLLVLVDGVEDPRNLGSIIRSAEAVGANGVVIPKRRNAQLTAACVRASAGASEHMPVARVANMARLISELKERDVWTVGADAVAPLSLWEADLRRHVALVIGGEDRGLSRLVKERCDSLVRIPMRGSVSCLNAAVAGALLMYEALRQRSAAVRGHEGVQA